jgi:hypothetical protein
MVSQFPVFFEEGKEVRKRKVAEKIGRTVQHEILAEKWKVCFREGMVGVVIGK